MTTNIIPIYDIELIDNKTALRSIIAEAKEWIKEHKNAKPVNFYDTNDLFEATRKPTYDVTPSLARQATSDLFKIKEELAENNILNYYQDKVVSLLMQYKAALPFRLGSAINAYVMEQLDYACFINPDATKINLSYDKSNNVVLDINLTLKNVKDENVLDIKTQVMISPNETKLNSLKLIPTNVKVKEIDSMLIALKQHKDSLLTRVIDAIKSFFGRPSNLIESSKDQLFFSSKNSGMQSANNVKAKAEQNITHQAKFGA